GSCPTRHPLAGGGCRRRLARLDLPQLAAHAGTPLADLAVRRVLSDHRSPCAEEIGAERDDIARSIEIEGRHLFVAEARAVRAPEDVVAERLERRHDRAAEPAGELRHQRGPTAAARTREIDERFLNEHFLIAV